MLYLICHVLYPYLLLLLSLSHLFSFSSSLLLPFSLPYSCFPHLALHSLALTFMVFFDVHMLMLSNVDVIKKKKCIMYWLIVIKLLYIAIFKYLCTRHPWWPPQVGRKDPWVTEIQDFFFPARQLGEIHQGCFYAFMFSDRFVNSLFILYHTLYFILKCRINNNNNNNSVWTAPHRQHPTWNLFLS